MAARVESAAGQVTVVNATPDSVLVVAALEVPGLPSPDPIPEFRAPLPPEFVVTPGGSRVLPPVDPEGRYPGAGARLFVYRVARGQAPLVDVLVRSGPELAARGGRVVIPPASFAPAPGGDAARGGARRGSGGEERPVPVFAVVADSSVTHPVARRQLGQLRALPWAESVRVVRLAGGADTLLAAGRALAFDVGPNSANPDGRVVAVGEQVARRAADHVTWSGRLRGDSAGHVGITRTPEGVRGSVAVGAEAYAVEPLVGAPGLHALTRLDVRPHAADLGASGHVQRLAEPPAPPSAAPGPLPRALPRVPQIARLGVEVYWNAPPDAATLRVGTRAQLRAPAFDAAGRQLAKFEFWSARYTSSDPRVAAVGDSGTLRTLRPGRAVVTATVPVRGRPGFWARRDTVLRGAVVVTVLPATPAYRRLAADARAVVTLAGYYVTGFEASAFRPCHWAETYFVPTLEAVPAVRAALTAVPRDEPPRPPGVPAPPPQMVPRHAYVRWRGTVTETGPYVPMQTAGRAFMPDTLYEARAPGPEDCRDEAARGVPTRGAPVSRGPARGTPAPPAPAAVLARAYHTSSGLTTPRRLVVRDAAAWRALWAELQRGHQDPAGLPPAPPVDFGRDMLLVAALGTRPDGGPTITIEDVRPVADALEVRVHLTTPGRGCIAPLEVSAPTDVVRVPRSDLPVRFVDRTEVRDCE